MQLDKRLSAPFEEGPEGQTHHCSSCEQAAKNLSGLLKLIGNPGVCGSVNRPGCGSMIVWIVTKAGARMPLNNDGTTHWSTCPKAREFKKERIAKR